MDTIGAWEGQRDWLPPIEWSHGWSTVALLSALYTPEESVLNHIFSTPCMRQSSRPAQFH